MKTVKECPAFGLGRLVELRERGSLAEFEAGAGSGYRLRRRDVAT